VATTKKPEPLSAAATHSDDLSLSDKELTQRVFEPDRSTLEATREAVRGVEDPAEAWETLAARGIVPSEWLGDSDRVSALVWERRTDSPRPVGCFHRRG
jgi:hypothetical protein